MYIDEILIKKDTNMATLTIQIPDKEKDLFLQFLKKFNGKVVNKEPNELTKKTIEDVRNGKGLEEPIKSVKSFMESL